MQDTDAQECFDSATPSDELYSQNVWNHSDTTTLEALTPDLKSYKLPV